MPGLNLKQEDIDQFVAITQATPADAAQFLTDGVTLEGAIEDYFAAQDAGGGRAPAPGEDADEDMLDAALAASAGDVGGAAGGAGGASGASGARTLSGAPAEGLPEEWRQRGPRIAGVHDEDPTRHGNELYTGGERSGLAVQNPDDARGGGGGGAGGGRGVVNDILEQARQGGMREDEEATAPRPVNPWAGVGMGHTLGSDEAPSMPVGGGAGAGAGGAGRTAMPGTFAGLGSMGGDDEYDDDDDENAVERRLTFWRDGFSIEDGELHRYDDPASQQLLSLIHAGRAPLELFDVKFGQPLKIEVDQRTEEEYKPPPKKPFSGGGNRLGSAGETGTSGAASSGTTSASAAAAAPPPSGAELKLDSAKPSTSIQLRLGDGSKMVVKVNLDHTVADLRAHIAATRPDPRAFVLQTTFPNRELPDGETVEQAKLQNAVVVQRFV